MVAWWLTVTAVLGAAGALPLALQDLDMDIQDSASVGSYVREVRAAPPESYHISYEDEGDAEVGYNRKKEGKGKKGYQKFDSFHKKDGDSYAFEKQDSYGYDDDKKSQAHSDDGEGAHSERKEKKAAKKGDKYQELPIDESDSHSSSYDVSEGDVDDGSSSHHDAPPPESAHTSSGYDEADSANYELPASYTYGQGEEYNF